MHKGWFVLMGAVLGVGALTLSYFGNPANTGLCVSCFMENIAGAMGLHDNVRMQYLRPELIGLVLGAFVMALCRREFVPVGGSSPLLRFMIGFFLIVGCAVFIGCPVKMVLRITSGDVGALVGLVGLIVGIYVGLAFIENGFRLGRPGPQPRANSLLIPGFMFFLLILVLIEPSFVYKSSKGSGALRAPVLLSLGIGLLLGGLAQFTQFCITGGIARVFLWGPREVLNCPRSTGLLLSLGSFFMFALVASILTGQFSFGLEGQPSSNDSYGWAFLGMMMVGLGSVLIRGCPLRQLIASAQGDNDAGAAVLGMLLGAALSQSWNLAGTAAGTPVGGQIAVLAGLAIMLTVGVLNRRRGYGIAPEYQAGLD
jgi:hypothetical protein